MILREITGNKNRKRISIAPGEFHVSTENIVISTLLGSCVSACLYDPVMKVMGMNHFLLSNHRYSKSMPVCATEAGRYGIHSMELLINALMKRGAKRKNLKAKAFGGGSMWKQKTDNFFCVGDINSRFTREFLSNENIPLVTEDLGGDTGRVIHFSFGDFAVYVKKIQQVKSSELIQRERTFWKRSVETQRHQEADADIWE